MRNWYLKEYEYYQKHPQMWRRTWSQSHEMSMRYAWGIPNDNALRMIKRYSPKGVVEIGAGTGYWARLLTENYRVTPAAAYDIQPYNNRWCCGRWYEVMLGDENNVAFHSEQTLLLVYPPYQMSMAVNALKAYCGNTLIYVGEQRSGITGDDAFFDEIAEHWYTVDECEIPRWSNKQDKLMVYQRKS